MKNVGVVVLVLAVLALANAAFVVRETDQVIKTQFGKPVGDPITKPGLHFKLPVIQKIRRFDKRFLEWDGDATELTTKDKRFIFVDTYARWRITDPLLFFQRLQDERRAQSRLDDILDGETRNAIANHNLVELVRSSNREPEQDSGQIDIQAQLEEIQVGRELIRQEILRAAQSRTGDLGIEVLDVQIKRINYVEDVRRKVYDRMIAERRRIADRYRSEGEGEAARINGELERELKRIQSEAYRTAEEIIGTADAEATEIYAKAYDQSPDARSFYGFLKTMETLSSTADERTSILLSTEGEFYRFLTDIGR
ncbi:MAG: protease modulator HflC [Acidobacteriota bacterium]|nr:protease modulator HflC [Acidobacteriota bacterium]